MVIFQFEFEYFRHLSIFIHLKMKMLRLSKVLIHLKMKMLRLSNVLIHLKMKMLRPGKAKDVFIHFGPLAELRLALKLSVELNMRIVWCAGTPCCTQ